MMYKRDTRHTANQLSVSHHTNMNRNILLVALLLVLQQTLVLSCLITNCPRGGKRSGKLSLTENIKPCVSCGPGRSGQCFGPNICCGPFGCLLGTPETVICKREGFFQEVEPCIAGSMPCRKNTGRCAADGICCNQESCHSDKLCITDEKLMKGPNMIPLEFYGLMNYQNQPEYSSD